MKLLLLFGILNEESEMKALINCILGVIFCGLINVSTACAASVDQKHSRINSNQIDKMLSSKVWDAQSRQNTYGLLRNLFEYSLSPKQMPFRRTLTYFIANGHEISYCTREGKFSAEVLSVYFEAAVRHWTVGVAQWLEKDGKSEEFKYLIDEQFTKPIKFINKGTCSDETNIEGVGIILSSNVEDCGRETRSFYRGGTVENDRTPKICLLDTEIDAIRKKTVEFALNLPAFYANRKQIPDGQPKPSVEEYIKDFEEGKRLVSLDAQVTQDNLAYIQTLWTENESENPPKYFEINEDSFYAMVHETGHAFGLSDEYIDDKTGYNYNPIYSSPYRGTGIMNDSFSMRLNGDDVTGIIVLFNIATDRYQSFEALDGSPLIIQDGRYPQLPFQFKDITDKEQRKKFKKEWKKFKNPQIRIQRKDTAEQYQERIEKMLK